MLVEKIKQQLVNVIEDELMTEVRKHVTPANLLSPAIAVDDDGEESTYTVETPIICAMHDDEE